MYFIREQKAKKKIRRRGTPVYCTNPAFELKSFAPVETPVVADPNNDYATMNRGQSAASSSDGIYDVLPDIPQSEYDVLPNPPQSVYDVLPDRPEPIDMTNNI